MNMNDEKKEKIVEVLAHFLQEQWDDIVCNRMTEKERKWAQLKDELINITDDFELTPKIIGLLKEGTSTSYSKPTQARQLLGQAMVDLFLRIDKPLKDWLMLIGWWDVYEPFEHEIKETWEKKKDKYIDKICQISKGVFDHPEQLAFDSEKGRLCSYIEQWDKENRIDELWMWGHREFFPYDWNAFIFPKLLLPNEPELFLKLCDRLKAPCFLYELFASCCRKNGYKDLLCLLERAPISIKDKNVMAWNFSLTAPVILDELFQKIEIDATRTKEGNDDNKLNDIFEEISGLLKGREDGLFLAWNYVQYLIGKPRNNRKVSYLFEEALGRAFRSQFQKYSSRECDFKKMFPKDILTIRKNFTETGILENKQEKSVILDLLTGIKFESENRVFLTKILNYLETSIFIEDDNLIAYDADPRRVHYDFAKIYYILYQDDAVSHWERFWQCFSIANYRSNFNYYDQQSTQLRKNMNWVLLVGFSLMEILCSKGKFDQTNALWKKLWEIIMLRMKIRQSEREEFNISYIHGLLEYKVKVINIYDQNGNVEPILHELSDLLLALKSYPKLYLCLIGLLIKFNCTEKVVSSCKDRIQDIVETCRSAVAYCEWIDYTGRLVASGNRFLKDWRHIQKS